MSSEHKMSWLEGLCRCPGIVAALTGYIFVSLITVVLNVSLDGTAYEIPRHAIVVSPLLIFLLAYILPVTGKGRSRISSIQLFLFASAFHLGARHIYAPLKIGTGTAFLFDMPRLVFPGFSARLVAGTGHLAVTVLFFFLLFAPSVRRWVRSGTKPIDSGAEKGLGEKGDAIAVQKEGFTGGVGFWSLARVSLGFLVGVALASAVLLCASIAGKEIPSPDKMSFEALMEQLETEEHWQLRLRHELNRYIGWEVMMIPQAELPPSTVSQLRVEAVDGLSRFGSRALNPLEGLLADPDVSVRQAALAVLEALEDESVEGVDSSRP